MVAGPGRALGGGGQVLGRHAPRTPVLRPPAPGEIHDPGASSAPACLVSPHPRRAVPGRVLDHLGFYIAAGAPEQLRCERRGVAFRTGRCLLRFLLRFLLGSRSLAPHAVTRSPRAPAS